MNNEGQHPAGERPSSCSSATAPRLCAFFAAQDECARAALTPPAFTPSPAHALQNLQHIVNVLTGVSERLTATQERLTAILSELKSVDSQRFQSDLQSHTSHIQRGGQEEPNAAVDLPTFDAFIHEWCTAQLPSAVHIASPSSLAVDEGILHSDKEGRRLLGVELFSPSSCHLASTSQRTGCITLQLSRLSQQVKSLTQTIRHHSEAYRNAVAQVGRAAATETASLKWLLRDREQRVAAAEGSSAGNHDGAPCCEQEEEEAYRQLAFRRIVGDQPHREAATVTRLAQQQSLVLSQLRSQLRSPSSLLLPSEVYRDRKVIRRILQHLPPSPTAHCHPAAVVDSTGMG